MNFELSPKEIKNYKKFRKEMDKKYSDEDQYCGAIGGFFSITFTPTGLGNIITVTTIKGDSEDITDYDLF